MDLEYRQNDNIYLIVSAAIAVVTLTIILWLVSTDAANYYAPDEQEVAAEFSSNVHRANWAQATEIPAAHG